MSSVRKALHIRTGQRAASETLDAWLCDHHVDVLPFGDVYDACAHLLKGYESIPDLALVGTDWLSEDECRIVRYIRETWPRIGLIIYGLAQDTLVADFSPRTRTCRGQRALQRLIAQSPDDTVRELTGDIALPQQRTAPTPAVTPVDHGATPELKPPPRRGARDDRLAAMKESVPEDGNGHDESAAQDSQPAEPLGDVPEVQPPRAILTAEELSALLDAPDEH